MHVGDPRKDDHLIHEELKKLFLFLASEIPKFDDYATNRWRGVYSLKTC